MSWTDSYELPYATVIGRFGSIVSDSLDPDLRPDINPLSGTVTLTPTVPYIKISGTVLQISPITAQIANGVIVNPDGSEGIRILSTDVENDTITNWGWRATFKIPEVRITPVSFYAVEDEVIDLVNLTSGITGLPVEIAPGPKGDKGDPGEDGHTPEITFDGTTIVVDGTPGPDLKGDPGEGGGGIAGMVPIFATLAEAQAWEAENPGKIALTLEGQEPVGPVVWEASAPSFDVVAGTYTIPDDEGATYTVDGVTVAAGTHTVTPPVTVTVVAVENPGYSLAGVTEWTQEFVEITSPYEGQVFTFAPQHYWRLDETVPPIRDRGTGGPVTSSQATGVRLGWAGVGVGARAMQASFPFLHPTGIADATEYTFAGVTTIAPSTTTELVSIDGGPQLYYANSPSGSDGLPINALSFSAKGTPSMVSQRVLNLVGGEIVHVAVTLSGGTVRAYIDGVEVSSAPAQAVTGTLARLGDTNTTTERVGGIVVDLTKAATPAQIAAMSAAVQR